MFTLIGALVFYNPIIEENKLSNTIVSSLKDNHPELKKEQYGKPRHNQSKGSVERSNQDIDNMLTTRMQEYWM